MGTKKILFESLAIAEKELKIELRFKIPFFLDSIVWPVFVVVPFLLVYFGQFLSGAQNFGGITLENFVPFLLLGTISSIALHTGFTNTPIRFQREKYWQTIESIQIAPINKLSVIIGHTIFSIITVLPAAAIIMLLLQYFSHTSILNIFFILLILIPMLLISISLGIIAGISMLFDESYLPFFRSLVFFITFFSCFYYPIAIFDQHALLALLKPFVLVNPFYHGVTILRSLWFSGTTPLSSIAILLMFAIIMPFLSSYLFNRAWKKFTIQG